MIRVFLVSHSVRAQVLTLLFRFRHLMIAVSLYSIILIFPPEVVCIDSIPHIVHMYNVHHVHCTCIQCSCTIESIQTTSGGTRTILTYNVHLTVVLLTLCYIFGR
jgi:hypothetical protein